MSEDPRDTWAWLKHGDGKNSLYFAPRNKHTEGENLVIACVLLEFSMGGTEEAVERRWY